MQYGQSHPTIVPIDLVTNNLCNSPDDLASANWSKQLSTITSNDQLGLTGVTADLLVEDTTTGGHRVIQGVSIPSAGRYRLEVFAKNNSGTRGVTLDISTTNSSDGAYVKYDMDGTVTEASSTWGSSYFSNTSSSTEAAINGLRRFTLEVDIDQSMSALVIIGTEEGGLWNFLGDGSSICIAGILLKKIS